ncbi:MAG: hypothetical protein IKW60_00535 [Clostridia bacterium]|nr:hypothetical protein [Clostridia bacterium]
MKKRWVVLSIVIIFLLLLSGLAYWQRNNISALITGLTSTEEEITEKLAEQEKELLEKLSEVDPELQVNPLTEEQEQMLKDGTMTADEAIAIITGKAETTDATEPAEENSTLNNLIAQIYVIRSNFTGQLNGLVGQAKQEYINGGGKISKESIAKKYMSIAGGLEAQCDGQMASILSQIQAELERTGGDMSLVSQIRSAYYGEKSAKKAQLLSQF